MPTLTIGPLGDSMAAPHYMPYGNPLFELPLTLSPTTIVINMWSTTGETWTATGAFSFGTNPTWPFINGTINTITDVSASGQLLYQFTNLSVSFATYISFANNQDSVGWEKAALGPTGAMFGGAGDDTFIGFPGTHTYDGGGGVNTIDFLQGLPAGSSPVSLVIDTYNQKIASTNSSLQSGGFAGTFANIEVFGGLGGAPTSFISGPGNHRFFGHAAVTDLFDPLNVDRLYFGYSANPLYQVSVPDPTGPVFLNWTNNTAINGYGGSDVFSNINKFYVGAAPSVTIIAGPGTHEALAGAPSLTLDYSHAPGGVTVQAMTTLPGFAPVVRVQPTDPIPADQGFNILNGFGGRDYISRTPSLDFQPGPGHNDINIVGVIGSVLTTITVTDLGPVFS